MKVFLKLWTIVPAHGPEYIKHGYQLVLLYQIKRQQVPVCLRSPKKAWAKNSQVTHKQLKFKYFTKH